MLNIDQFFFKAIDQNASIQSLCPSRIFNTARDKDAEAADKIPYIIVTYEGGAATDMTKDDIVAELDYAEVGVLCCAETRNDLASLTKLVETAIKSACAQGYSFYEETWDFGISKIVPDPMDVEMDQEKPCYIEKINYKCDTYKR